MVRFPFLLVCSVLWGFVASERASDQTLPRRQQHPLKATGEWLKNGSRRRVGGHRTADERGAAVLTWGLTIWPRPGSTTQHELASSERRTRTRLARSVPFRSEAAAHTAAPNDGFFFTFLCVYSLRPKIITYLEFEIYPTKNC